MHSWGEVVVSPQAPTNFKPLKCLLKKAIFKRKAPFINLSIAINIHTDKHNIAYIVMLALTIYAFVAVNKKLLAKFTEEIKMYFKTMDFFKPKKFEEVIEEVLGEVVVYSIS